VDYCEHYYVCGDEETKLHLERDFEEDWTKESMGVW
jgi:hypothetical protein